MQLPGDGEAFPFHPPATATLLVQAASEYKTSRFQPFTVSENPNTSSPIPCAILKPSHCWLPPCDLYPPGCLHPDICRSRDVRWFPPPRTRCVCPLFPSAGSRCVQSGVRAHRPRRVRPGGDSTAVACVVHQGPLKCRSLMVLRQCCRASCSCLFLQFESGLRMIPFN